MCTWFFEAKFPSAPFPPGFNRPIIFRKLLLDFLFANLNTPNAQDYSFSKFYSVICLCHPQKRAFGSFHRSRPVLIAKLFFESSSSSCLLRSRQHQSFRTGRLRNIYSVLCAHQPQKLLLRNPQPGLVIVTPQGLAVWTQSEVRIDSGSQFYHFKNVPAIPRDNNVIMCNNNVLTCVEHVSFTGLLPRILVFPV